MLRPERLQLLPLGQRKHTAEIQRHGCELALQLSSRFKHLVHLLIDLRFVGAVGIHQSLQLQVLLLSLDLVVNQVHSVLIKDLVELGQLLIGKLQLLGDLRVLPPLP